MPDFVQTTDLNGAPAGNEPITGQQSFFDFDAPPQNGAPNPDEGNGKDTNLPPENGSDELNQQPGIEDVEPNPDEKGAQQKKEITHDPLKDTQRAFHQKAQEVARLRQENERLLNELMELKNSIVGGFKKLSDQELESLKYDDPDAYVNYLRQQEQIKTLENKSAQVQQAIASQKTVENLTNVLNQELGIDPSSPDFQRFLASREFREMDRWITANVLPESDGSYSPQVIKAALYAVAGDKIINRQKQFAHQATIQNIDSASKGARPLDKAASQGHKIRKSINDYTQDEIAAMGEDELNQLLEMAEQ